MHAFKFDTWAMLVITMAVLAGIAMYALKDVVLPPGPESEQQPHIMDFYLRNFSAVTMDEQGAPRHQLSADYMLHYRDDESALLDMPKLKVSGKNEPWYLHAENGTTSARGDEVTLHGAVVIVRAGEERGLSVVTRELRVIPGSQIAETAEEVTIQNNISIVRGVGLRANLREDRLELLSQVSGEYALR